MLLLKELKNTVEYNGKTIKIGDAFVNAAYALDRGPIDAATLEAYLADFDKDVIAKANEYELAFALEYAIRDEFISFYGEEVWNFFKDGLVKDYNEIVQNGDEIILKRANGEVVRDPATESAPSNGICECPHCLKRTPYIIKKQPGEFYVGQHTHTCLIPYAECQLCGTEAYVPGIREMAGRAFDEARKNL